MNEAVEKTFQELISTLYLKVLYKNLGDPHGKEKTDAALTFLDALKEGRFHYEAETWHNTKEADDQSVYPAEMLIRARTIKGEPISPLAPITQLNDMKLYEMLDKAIVLSAIDQALEKNQMPISINTSARNLKSPGFWEELSQMLDDHFDRKDIKGQLTFEVTEDDPARNPCRKALQEMKEKYDCKFALDDFLFDYKATNGKSADWERLDNLKEIIDFVKIDGEIVQECLHSESNAKLADIVSHVHEVVPNAHFVFERVRNEQQALRIGGVVGLNLGPDAVAAVQGRNLEEDRNKFHRNLQVAAQALPSCPKPTRMTRKHSIKEAVPI